MFTCSVQIFSPQNLVDDAVDPSMRQITCFPPIADSARCINIFFGDDSLVEPDQYLVVVFTPSNNDDMFVGGNVANVTIIDDEGKPKPTYRPDTLPCW